MNKTVLTMGVIASLALGGYTLDESRNPYTDKGTFYEATIASDAVKIDKTTSAVTLERWNGEEGITVKAVGAYDSATRPLLTNRMEAESKDGKTVTVIEPIEGGINIDTILNERPDTNVFSYEIQGAEDMDFFYQPELTAEEIAEGAERLENVIGSYAVYHKTKKNHIEGQTNYETGKAYHIYRPKIIDNSGAEVWGELSYESGLLSVTVPQKFLDTAEYPVKVDPEFGYTSLGASTGVIAGGQFDQAQMIGNAFNLGEAGTLDSIHLGMAKTSQTDDVDTFAALYREDSSGSGSHDLVVGIERASLTISTTPAFYTFTGASESLSADDYIIAGVGDGEDVIGNENLNLYHDTAQPNINLYAESTLGAGAYATRKAENPWTETAAVSTNRRSVYVTYTASAGGGTMNNPSDTIIFD